ncbi:IS607 family element RNA-guided endonuclease TnpB [Nocardia vinacea]|uniref:IS607 family element RNA-guided endonuclease TnpB n=1 Tax=Nocardia vinacea TaxID=96468 RepID=UPI0002F60AB9|nr:IS607 family element RNA-guided endonuclease TnpB [Nocardia vinacea]
MGKFEPRAGFQVQAYRFALDPNAATEQRLKSHCGAARAAFNWAVAWVRSVWWQRAAEQSYGVPTEELTAWRSFSLPALRKAFNQIKHIDPHFAGWWTENSKEAYNTGLALAAAAFDNYCKFKNGQRRGKRMGMPRFKSKHRATPSCRFTTGTIRVDPDRRHVTLPRLGTIRTHESTRKLERRLAAGTARILSATVRVERGRWYIAFQVEVQRTALTPVRPDTIAGIDVGIKHLAVLADNAGQIRYEPNPTHLGNALTRLRKLSRRVSRRRGPDHRKGVNGSRRWEKANAARNKVHHRIANQRADALHKFTTRVRREYATVVVEDLNVAGMLRNRRLARHIADAGFGEIRRQLTYKGEWAGGTTVIADRWFASSKTCSGCGVAKTKLPLHVRVFTCNECGLILDRDANAARNLATLAASCSAGTGVAGDQDTTVSKPRGADRKTRATRTSCSAGAGRAGGATLPTGGGRKRETVPRTSSRSRGGDTGTDLPGANTRNADT